MEGHEPPIVHKNRDYNREGRTLSHKRDKWEPSTLVPVPGGTGVWLQKERYIFQGGRCSRDQLHDTRDRISIIFCCFSFGDSTDCKVLKVGKAGEVEREVNNVFGLGT